MGEGTHLLRVALQRIELPGERPRDVDEDTRVKSIRVLMESPFSGGGDLESQDFPNEGTGKGPGRRHHGPIDDRMVDVQIAPAVGVDQLGAEAGHELFQGMDDLEQGKAVEAIVGQAEEDDFLRSQDVRGCRRRATQGLEGDRVGLLSPSVPRRHAFSHDDDADRVAFTGRPSESAPTPQDFIVGMGGDTENVHV